MWGSILRLPTARAPLLYPDPWTTSGNQGMATGAPLYLNPFPKQLSERQFQTEFLIDCPLHRVSLSFT